MKLAVGGKAAATEAQRMVREKIEANLALQGKALSGGLGTTALSAAAKSLNHYRQKVRANQTRLAKGCLLYTSPSPRDYAASRMPSSA